MVRENKLCLVFVKYVIGFENIRYFVPVPSPAPNQNNFFLQTFILNLPETSKHRNDVSNSVNSIIKPRYSQVQFFIDLRCYNNTSRCSLGFLTVEVICIQLWASELA